MYFWECKLREEFVPFLEWLTNLSDEQYPVEFYLNGITYTLKNDIWAAAFIAGIWAAMDAEDYERIH